MLARTPNTETPETAQTPKRARTRGTPRALFGLALLAPIVALAVLGPLLAPEDPAAVVGASFAPPAPGTPLGTDFLGRDVLSRVLSGGWTVVALSVVSAAAACAVGTAIGLVAGMRGGRTETLLMRPLDAILAVPALLLLLVLASAGQRSVGLLVLAVALSNAPSVARVVRAATLDVARRPFVEAAVLRGEPGWRVLAGEVLPNIAGTVLADAGLRLAAAIYLVATASFLGLGLQPPTADWSLMISENRQGILLQSWPVIAPAALIVLFAVGANLAFDGLLGGRRSGVGRKG